MSIFRQTTAIWVCGMCPECRAFTADCESKKQAEGLGSDWIHYYECSRCGKSDWFGESQIKLAYDDVKHWDGMPKTRN